jgi:hypothetical protein
LRYDLKKKKNFQSLLKRSWTTLTAINIEKTIVTIAYIPSFRFKYARPMFS